MINIYIKDFNQNGRIVTGETLMQKIPADSEGGLRLITPIVKAEMGTVDGLDFSIESGTPFYDAFKQMKTFIRVVYDGTTIFYGRVLTIDNNSFRGTRKIRCEGPMAFLMDSPVEGVEESKRTNISTYEYIQQLLDNHNSYINNEANKRFLVGEVPGHYSGWVSAAQRVKNDTRPFGSDSWTDTKSALEDLRSHYGGYFRMRPAGGIGGGIYLDWMNHYFNPNTINQKVEVGKNILDISNVTEIDNVFTAIVPIGKHNVTTSEDGKSSSKQEDLYVDGKVVRVPEVCDHFGYEALSEGYHRYEDYRDAISKYGMIIKQVSFPNAENKTTLYNEACEWIKNNYQGEVTKFTVKAIDMHQLGENVAKINVGDRVTIVYPVAKEDGTFPKQSTTQTCLSIQYDLYHPENNSYTFGIPANILTKTYGLKKQGKSVNSASTSPSSGGGGGGGGGKKDWFWGYVVPWLQRHGLKYNPPGQKRDPNNPYWPYPGDAKGLEYTSGNMMLIIDGNSKTPSYLKKTLVKGSKVGSSWAGVLTSYDIDAYNHKLSEQVFYDYKVLEYVQWEYGIDLRTYFQGVTAPTSITTEEGLTKFFGAVKDVLTGVWMMFEEFVINPVKDSGFLNIFDLNYWFPGDNSPTSVAGFDFFGNYKFRYFTPDGELVDVNQRELHINQLHDEANIGWIIDEDPQTGERSFKNAGAMYLALEGHAGAQIVTAHLAGEVMYLGNYKTQKYYATSVNHMDQVCGDFEYVEDQTEPDGRRMVVHSGGGMRVWHAKIKKINPKTGEKTYETDDQGRLIYSEFGVFDDNVLTGGIVAEKLADGTVQTNISGDLINLSTNTEFGQITSTVGNHTVTLGDHGQRLDTIEGSTIWQTRDNITGFVGEFEFEGTGANRKLKIKNGGGIVVKRNDTEFGLYDNGNLSGGIIVNKINGGDGSTTSTLITGDKVSITGDTTVSGVLSVDSSGYLKVAKSIIIPGSGSIQTTMTGSSITAGTFIVPSNGSISFTGGGTGESYGLSTSTLKDMIKKAEVSDDKKTLTLTPFYGDPINFNRATAITMSWDSSTKAVVATPNAVSCKSNSYNIGTRFNSASGGYYIEAIHSESSGASALVSKQYKLYVDGRTVKITDTNNSQYSNTPSVTVNPPLQAKNDLTWSINGTYTLGPDSGYYGLSSVNVTVSVDAKHSPWAGDVTLQGSSASTGGRIKAGSFKKSNLSAPGYIFFRAGCGETARNFYITVDP